MNLDQFEFAESIPQIINLLKARGAEIDDLKIDGKWHAFRIGSAIKKKGSYRCIETSLGITLEYKNFKDPSDRFKKTFTFKHLSREELEIHEQRVLESLQAEERRKEIKWSNAALDAERLWKNSVESSHPYLIDKKLKQTYGTRVTRFNRLLIPAKDAAGKMWSYQSIAADGQKYNQQNGKLKGCFHLIGAVTPGATIFICEGFSTAATVYEETGFPSICTFSSYFFLEAAHSLRTLYPDNPLIFSGDADVVGLKYSMMAARKFKSKFVVPKFKSPHPDYTDWNDLRDLEGEGIVRMQLLEQPKNQHDFPEQKFVIDSLDALRIKVDLDGAIHQDNLGKSLQQIAAEIRVRATELQEKIPKGFIADYLIKWHPQECLKIRQEFISKFFDTSKIDNDFKIGKTFLKAMLKREDEIAASVLLHFIWQVKRKMIGLPVFHHMMPVFWGQTGQGKSMAILALLSPLNSLASCRTLDIFGDSRAWGFFENHYVIFFDEMVKGIRADTDAMKHVITSDNFSIEPKYEGTKRVRQNSTFIGASNEPLESIIQDETSNRRFFPIEATEDTDREIINSIDYLSLWQSVDEKQDCPIVAYLPEVKEKQRLNKNQSPIEMYLNEFQFRKTHKDEALSKIAIENKKLLSLFNAWAKEQCFEYGLNMRSLTPALRKIGVARAESNGRIFYLLHSEMVPATLQAFEGTTAKVII